MIDAAKQNDEILRDSEPNLAVNPNNPLQMAASAFTPDPLGGPNAPIYISIDGGRSWKLCAKLPFNYPITGTGDITLRFGTTSDMLYVAALKKTDTGLPPPAWVNASESLTNSMRWPMEFCPSNTVDQPPCRRSACR
jgi:hypothetical protein